jgi:hypothetical protein
MGNKPTMHRTILANLVQDAIIALQNTDNNKALVHLKLAKSVIFDAY